MTSDLLLGGGNVAKDDVGLVATDHRPDGRVLVEGVTDLHRARSPHEAVEERGEDAALYEDARPV